MNEFWIEDKEGNPSPIFLQNTLGSLSEERRSSRSRSFKKLQKLRRFALKKFKEFATWSECNSNRSQFDIKLSPLVAWCSAHQLSTELRWNPQRVANENRKDVRALLIYTCFFDFSEEDFWQRMFVEEVVDYGLTFQRKEGKISTEIFAIASWMRTLDRSILQKLLTRIYSQDNLDRWKDKGWQLVKSLSVVSIPSCIVRQKVRRRGYHETHGNKHKSKDERTEIAMSTEARTLEEIKESIRLKQAQIFEHQLDLILESYNQNVPDEIIRQKWLSLQNQTEIDVDKYSTDFQKGEDR